MAEDERSLFSRTVGDHPDERVAAQRRYCIGQSQRIRGHACERLGQLLGMPIGSIGPTLRRSLDRLRETSAMRAYLATPAADEGNGGGQRVLAGVD